MNDNKEYLTLAEVAKHVGVKRTSLYYYIDKMGIKTHDFEFSNHKFLHIKDAERIKIVREKPWLTESIKEEIAQEKKSKEVKPEEPAA